MQLHLVFLKLTPDAFLFCLASFKTFAYSHPLTELMTAEESEAAVQAKAAALVKTESAIDNEETVNADGEAEPEKLVEATVESTGAEELEKYIGVREAFYKAAKEWDVKIRDFENAIRRPYFHVRLLDDAQLANWHKYLDFVEKEGGVEKVGLDYLMVVNILLKTLSVF